MHALGGARKAPGLRDRKTNLRTRSRDSPIYENEQIDDAKRAPKHLEVESQIGIPSSFDLVINVEHSNHHCHVVWRKARRIGVAFD